MEDIRPVSDTERAEAMARGLEELAAFIREHPELPVFLIEARESVHSGTDAEKRAEVDRIAAILGRNPQLNENGTHCTVVRRFGGGVSYEATAITEAHMRRYSEHMKPFHEAERSR